MSYADFIESKRRSVAPLGKPLSCESPDLYRWQRDAVAWACERGRAAVFADCGMGKTRIQLEWARLMGERALVLAPLSVARQTVREADAIGVPARYLRADDGEAGVVVTNYEMIDRFDPDPFDAVVLDEASILKHVDSKTRRLLTDRMRHVPYRLSCTATPAPNDAAELVNQADYLGVMSRVEMLAAYFVHDDDGWRLKGHAREAMYEWMASWSLAMRHPSDLGYPDDGYELPPLHVIPEIVDVEITADGQLFATDLGGVGGRSRVRRETLDARCTRACELASEPGQWIVWTGLNDEADRVSDAVSGAVNVHGSLSPDEKAERLEAFQDGEIRVLVTKPSIAGFGMNFQQCSQMVFLGLSDSYEAYYQAIRRCYRFGQASPVRAHIVLSELESAIAENVRAKEREANHITDGLVRHSTLGASVAA
jgi:superfamily II DNA or RNA helicase